MLVFSVEVKTKNNITAKFQINDFSNTYSNKENGINISISNQFPYKITITPPEKDKLIVVNYRVSTGLKNYHLTIIPDSGRTYPSQFHLVDFWSGTWQSRVNNIRMPVFILTGMDMYAKYVFGVIGENYETDFKVEEPAQGRALSAWMKRLTLKIQRGTDSYPIPEFAFSQKDNSLTEYLYFKHEDQIPKSQPWIETLRQFAQNMAQTLNKKQTTTNATLLPYWCSWTDWHSDQVTEDTILENVQQGAKLGIKNYIIDDGWFGPGLDSDFSVDLNIGDWEEDKTKIKDLKKLVGKIHNHDVNAIIWCAPHAVAPKANCFEERKPYLIRNQNNELLETSNKFHSLCFMCPEAREIMADVCANLIKKYDLDGAKYDLFNCVPDVLCCNKEHKHDTSSMIEGLRKTLELIKQKTHKVKKDLIVELKQNYGTPYLYEYGSCMRAGDTPYNPEGNFLRTAFINAYTPYALNDYQTITNNDSEEDAISIIIKMIAVGIPSYSINFSTLSKKHKKIISFYNKWYIANLEYLRDFRFPIDPRLDSWRSNNGNIFFMLNNQNKIKIDKQGRYTILNGTYTDKIYIEVPQNNAIKTFILNYKNNGPKNVCQSNNNLIALKSKIGDIITLDILH